MSDYKDELVDIYASYDKLSEAEKSSEYQKLCEQHDEKNSPFHKFRKDIAEIKGFLEENIDQEQLSEKGQISVSLKLMQIVLKNLKNKNEEDILNYCRKLIINTYSKNWSPEQLDYFEKISDKLTTPDYDYFLSFTRRNRSAGEYNIVNKNYEYFIKDTLGKHSFKKEEIIKKNLLARSIHHLLRTRYKGFFYPDYIGDNQLVDPKVERACKNSLLFIQLIQNMMFEKPDVENYCFKEYNYVIGSFSEAQIIFVLAEGSYEKLYNWDDVCFDYQKWRKHVSRKNNVILRFTTIWKKSDIDSIKKEIEENIGNKIKEYKDNICENVP